MVESREKLAFSLTKAMQRKGNAQRETIHALNHV